MIPFRISCVSARFSIRTPTDKDQKRLLRYEATSKFPWDPLSATHAGNEEASQSKSTYNRVKPQRDDLIVNLSNLWWRDVTLLTQLHQEDSLYKDSDEYQTTNSIESSISMNGDDDGERNYHLNAVVTKARILEMYRKLINYLSNIP